MTANTDAFLVELHEAAQRHGDSAVRDEVGDILRYATISIVEPNTSVPSTCNGTAAIRRVGTRRYHVSFWRTFLDRFARTAEDRLFLLLHELAHQRHGDLLRDNTSPHPEIDAQVVNAVEDMVINAELCRRWFPTGVPMLSRLAQAARGERSGRVTVFNHLLLSPMTVIGFYREEMSACSAHERWLAEDGVTYARLAAWGTENFAALLQRLLAPGRACPIADICLADIAQIYVHGWFLQAPIWNLASWVDNCLGRCLWDEQRRSRHD